MLNSIVPANMGQNGPSLSMIQVMPVHGPAVAQARPSIFFSLWLWLLAGGLWASAAQAIWLIQKIENSAVAAGLRPYKSLSEYPALTAAPLILGMLAPLIVSAAVKSRSGSGAVFKAIFKTLLWAGLINLTVLGLAGTKSLSMYGSVATFLGFIVAIKLLFKNADRFDRETDGKIRGLGKFLVAAACLISVVPIGYSVSILEKTLHPLSDQAWVQESVKKAGFPLLRPQYIPDRAQLKIISIEPPTAEGNGLMVNMALEGDNNKIIIISQELVADNFDIQGFIAQKNQGLTASRTDILPAQNRQGFTVNNNIYFLSDAGALVQVLGDQYSADEVMSVANGLVSD